MGNDLCITVREFWWYFQFCLYTFGWFFSLFWNHIININKHTESDHGANTLLHSTLNDGNELYQNIGDTNNKRLNKNKSWVYMNTINISSRWEKWFMMNIKYTMYCINQQKIKMYDVNNMVLYMIIQCLQCQTVRRKKIIQV